MNYLAILGRQPEISVAELEALGNTVTQVDRVGNYSLAEVRSNDAIDPRRLGGTQKIGILLTKTPLAVLSEAPAGKITFGISELGPKASLLARTEAAQLKRQLTQQGRSVRIVESKTGVLSCATTLHNGLSGQNPRKFEFLHYRNRWYRVTGVQDINAYAERDQKRPARDAKIGMLPPKLAQVLLNLASALPPHSRVLDPFCGTGVVLQEAILMNYRAYGTDLDPRMVDFSRRNLTWLLKNPVFRLFLPQIASSATISSAKSVDPAAFPNVAFGNISSGQVLSETARGVDADSAMFPDIASEDIPPEQAPFELATGDATTFQWQRPLDAVVTEGYLGQPFSHLPSGAEVKEQILTCKTLLARFLRNLAPQIRPQTPVILCAPAWLRENGTYLRLNLLDDIEKLGYNVNNKTRAGLLYHREGQIVARDIIILRKK